MATALHPVLSSPDALGLIFAQLLDLLDVFEAAHVCRVWRDQAVRIRGWSVLSHARTLVVAPWYWRCSGRNEESWCHLPVRDGHLRFFENFRGFSIGGPSMHAVALDAPTRFRGDAIAGTPALPQQVVLHDRFRGNIYSAASAGDTIYLARATFSYDHGFPLPREWKIEERRAGGELISEVDCWALFGGDMTPDGVEYYRPTKEFPRLAVFDHSSQDEGVLFATIGRFIRAWRTHPTLERKPILDIEIKEPEPGQRIEWHAPVLTGIATGTCVDGRNRRLVVCDSDRVLEYQPRCGGMPETFVCEHASGRFEKPSLVALVRQLLVVIDNVVDYAAGGHRVIIFDRRQASMLQVMLFGPRTNLSCMSVSPTHLSIGDRESGKIHVFKTPPAVAGAAKISADLCRTGRRRQGHRRLRGSGHGLLAALEEVLSHDHLDPVVGAYEWCPSKGVLVHGAVAQSVQTDNPNGCGKMDRGELWVEVCRLLHEEPRLRTTLTIPDEFASEAATRFSIGRDARPPLKQLRLHSRPKWEWALAKTYSDLGGPRNRELFRRSVYL